MLIIQNFYSNNISHIQWIYAMIVWYLHYEYKKVFITEKISILTLSRLDPNKRTIIIF